MSERRPPSIRPRQGAGRPPMPGEPRRHPERQAAEQAPPQTSRAATPRTSAPATPEQPVPASRPPVVPTVEKPSGAVRVRDDASARTAMRWAPTGSQDPKVSTRMVERRDEKRRAKRKAFMRRFGKRVAWIAVVVAVVWGILASPAFSLNGDKVTVSGQGEFVSLSTVEGIVAEYSGTSLAMLNTGEIANRLREIPGVRDVKIVRKWPQGLSVSIDAREPVAIVPAGADASGIDNYWLVDAEGVQVGKTDIMPAGLPLLSVSLGENDQRIVTGVMHVLTVIPTELKERVASIGAQTEDSIVLTLTSGPRVEWGSSQQSELKAQVVMTMLNDPTVGSRAVLDVSAPTTPISRNEN